MDPTAIVELATLVAKGIARLAAIVPLWLGAKTPEERDAIRLAAEKSVGELDAHFAEVDAKDKAAQDKLQAEIDAAKAGVP